MSIIVGVDGSDNSRKALEWAVEEARVRQTDLVVVHAYSPPLTSAAYPIDPWVGVGQLYDEDALGRAQASAGELLEGVLADMADELQDVTVRAEAIGHPQPSRALLERAENAELLVVGSRGHGGFTGLVLGSVSQQCVAHAPCPVTVVRDAKET